MSTHVSIKCNQNNQHLSLWQLGSPHNVPTGPNLKDNGWMETTKERALQSEISSKQ